MLLTVFWISNHKCVVVVVCVDEMQFVRFLCFPCHILLRWFYWRAALCGGRYISPSGPHVCGNTSHKSCFHNQRVQRKRKTSVTFWPSIYIPYNGTIWIQAPERKDLKTSTFWKWVSSRRLSECVLVHHSVTLSSCGLACVRQCWWCFLWSWSFSKH